MRQFLPRLLWPMPGGVIVLQNYHWTEETGTFSFNCFWDPSKSPQIFCNSFGFIATFLEIDGQYASTIPKWSAEIFFCRMVETKFFRNWLTFFMPNSTVLFPCRADVKKIQFGTCDDKQNHRWITCVLHQKFPVSTFTRLFLSVNCLGIHLAPIYQHIINFTNFEPSITFEHCEYCTSCFISLSIIQSTTSFIVVNIFLLLLVESVYPWIYHAFRYQIYTEHIL